MYNKFKGGEYFIEIKNMRETLGDELFFKLKKIENFYMLDHSVFVFFILSKGEWSFIWIWLLFKILREEKQVQMPEQKKAERKK